MILTLIVYRKSDNLLKKKKKKKATTLSGQFLFHMAMFFFLLNCVLTERYSVLERYLNLSFLKQKIPVVCLKSQFSWRELVKMGGKKIQFFFFFLVLCVLLGNSLELRALIWSHLWDDIVFFVGRKVFCLNQLSRGLI